MRLDQLTKVNTDTVDIAALVKARLIPKWAKRVKVIASGKLDKPVSLQGIMVSAGARRAIEAAGGRIGE
ncbi:ribosomal protein L15 [Nitrosococcus oceani AFC27]|nr:ribosomal protein L15 [Nitrosococcus oceani AFC27]